MIRLPWFPVFRTGLASALVAGALGTGCRALDGRRSMADIAARRQAVADASPRIGTPLREPEAAPAPDGQETLSAPLTLATALRQAMTHNAALQTVLAQRPLARGRVLEALSGALPDLRATAGLTQLDRSPATDDVRQTLALRASQPLYRAGAVSASIRAARFYAVQTEAGIRAAVQNTLYEVTRAYYGIALAQQLLRVAEAALASGATQLEDVRRQRAQGTAADYDVLRTEVEVARLHARAIAQRNAVELARVLLLRHIGLPQTTPLDVVGALPYAAEDHDADDLTALALALRPDLHQAEAALAMQAEAVRIARSARYPSIDLFAEAGFANPDPHRVTVNAWGETWSAGVTLSHELFDGFARRGRLAQEQARLEQAERALADAEQRAHVEVFTALLTLRNAAELVNSQAQNLERAQAALRLAEIRFREGQSTPVEILDARNALTEARGIYCQSIHTHLMARLDLRRATGVLGPAPGEIVDPETYVPDATRIPGAAP